MSRGTDKTLLLALSEAVKARRETSKYDKQKGSLASPHKVTDRGLAVSVK
jgi:hypothetical protein